MVICRRIRCPLCCRVPECWIKETKWFWLKKAMYRLILLLSFLSCSARQITANIKKIHTLIISLIALTESKELKNYLNSAHVVELEAREKLRICYTACSGRIWILVAVTLSGILQAKQKLGIYFKFNKLGGIHFTKFSKLTMCSA